MCRKIPLPTMCFSPLKCFKWHNVDRAGFQRWRFSGWLYSDWPINPLRTILFNLWMLLDSNMVRSAINPHCEEVVWFNSVILLFVFLLKRIVGNRQAACWMQNGGFLVRKYIKCSWLFLLICMDPAPLNIIHSSWNYYYSVVKVTEMLFCWLNNSLRVFYSETGCLSRAQTGTWKLKPEWNQ